MPKYAGDGVVAAFALDGEIAFEPDLAQDAQVLGEIHAALSQRDFAVLVLGPVLSRRVLFGVRRQRRRFFVAQPPSAVGECGTAALGCGL